MYAIRSPSNKGVKAEEDRIETEVAVIYPPTIEVLDTENQST